MFCDTYAPAKIPFHRKKNLVRNNLNMVIKLGADPKGMGADRGSYTEVFNLIQFNCLKREILFTDKVCSHNLNK